MNRRFVAAVALVVAVTAGSASAVSIKIETEPYPIDRLIRNLEAQARENPGDWDIAKRLARLHGMAYALKIDSIDVVSNHPGTTFQGREFYGDDRHVLPHRPVVEPEDDSQRRIAESHLLQALLWYERSLEASPDHPLALLGYGWCLKEAGHKEEAKRAFRTIIEQATEFEDPPSFGGFAWAYEATQYLLELLHPVWNFWEYRLRKKQLAFLEENRSDSVSPVVIPLEPDLAPEDILDPRAHVGFDLDCTGRPQSWTWINSNAAWLIHDYDGRRDIASGRDLFGNRTFDLFWDNGFEPVAVLDDNRDCEIAGPELEELGLWRDINKNGVCDDGEFQTVQEAGIVSLRFDFREIVVGGVVMWAAYAGVEFTTGETRTTYDLVLQRVQPDIVASYLPLR